MSGRSFVKGAAVLSAASLLCKALSAVFKIPLDRFFLGPEGIAIYQNAYNIYNWILAVSATGIPLAISSLVADSDEDDAARIRSSALWTVTAVGAVIAAALFAFAEPIASQIAGGGHGPAAGSIRVMSAGVLFLGVSGAYRGYFQGRGDMLPSAISQIADSLSKACVGLALCAALLDKGTEAAAAGAMGGVSIGAAAAAVILLIMGKKRVGVYRRPSLGIAKRIILYAIPVTLGAAGFSCMMLCDNFTVQSLLVSSGQSKSEAAELFGYLTRAFMIYNLPATLISAVTMSVAPACAEAAAAGDNELVKENSISAMRILMLVSAPCMLGCLGFAEPILELLYGRGVHGELLRLVGVLMVLIPFSQVISGILQATGCVWRPIAVLGITAAAKTALNFVFIPSAGAAGAPLATVIAYSADCAALICLFCRHMGFGLPMGIFMRPIAAACAGMLCGRAAYDIIGGNAGFIAGAVVMAVIYAVLAVILKAVNVGRKAL